MDIILQIFYREKRRLAREVEEYLDLHPKAQTYDVCVLILKENGLQEINPVLLYGEYEVLIDPSLQDTRVVSLDAQEVYL